MDLLASAYLREWMRAVVGRDSAPPLFLGSAPSPELAVDAAHLLGREGSFWLLVDDPWDRDALLAGLTAAGLGERVRSPAGVRAPEPGEIVIAAAALPELVGPLLDSARERPVLLALTSGGPEAVPFAAAADLLRESATDLLLRFPHEGLRRAGKLGGSVADLPPHARRSAEAYATLFGERRPEWLSRWRAAAAERGDPAADAEAGEQWTDRLLGVDRERPGKAVQLWPPGLSPERALVSARDPWRVLAINRALRHPPLDLWTRDPAAPPIERPITVLDLFGQPKPSVPPRRAARVAPIANALWERFRDEVLTLRDLLAALCAADWVAEEISRALGLLKRTGRIHYATLHDLDAKLVFPRDPLVTPRKQHPRQHPDELGLLGEPV